ncbi:MAG: cytochrome c [Acidobacteria bacterium]|nr:cytochrome c [Acidobacteriota bacterium]
MVSSTQRRFATKDTKAVKPLEILVSFVANRLRGLGSTRRSVCAGVVLSLSLSACRQDMHDAPRYEPLEASAFFADGRSARPAVTNTVARGTLRADELLYRGKIGGQLADVFPMPVTAAMIARGQERFNVFCSPCHGRTGQGNGVVVQRGFRAPPSFHEERLRNAPVGYFFDVETNGFGAMQDYAAQVPVADRWAIIAYIRALQLSQQATADDVPADRRTDLDRPVAAPGAPAEAAAGEPPPPAQEGR